MSLLLLLRNHGVSDGVEDEHSCPPDSALEITLTDLDADTLTVLSTDFTSLDEAELVAGELSSASLAAGSLTLAALVAATLTSTCDD